MSEQPLQGHIGRGLRWKGLVIVAIPLIFEIAFAGLLMTMDAIVQREHEEVLRSEEVIASTYRLASLVVDAETAIRGYIITGQPRFTAPYVHAVNNVPFEMRRLHALARSPAEVGTLAILAQRILEYQKQQHDRVAGGRQADATAMVSSGAGRQKMDAFRVAIDRFVALERTHEAARVRRNASARRNLRNLILAGLLVNICAAAAMAMYFMSSITRRLAVLVENTFRIERREPLQTRVQGDDEIAQLDERFHNMAVALERSRLETEQTNAELESFSYSVSHDLRAPLRAVSGYARMIEEDYADRLDAEGRRYTATIRSEAQRMGRLIDDLLAFSRHGRKPLRLEPVDIVPIAREALADVPAVAHARVDVQFDSPPPALADRAMLRQVFVNLLSNAIKFSSRQAEIRIEVGGTSAEKENVYWVRDYGVGFDMRFAEKLFGVFQRLHAVDEFEGTGVGLAIVHRIIQRHGGRVWAEAEEGRGACFYFTLPRREDAT